MLTTPQTIYTSIFIYVIPLYVMIFYSIIIGAIWFVLNGLLSMGIGYGMVFITNNTTLIKISAWTKPPVIALLLYCLFIAIPYSTS